MAYYMKTFMTITGNMEMFISSCKNDDIIKAEEKNAAELRL